MKKIMFIVGMLIAGVAMAEHYERVSVCVPLFGFPTTISGTYVDSTEYIYTPGPTVRYYVAPPPPPRHHHHHRVAPPPPPPPPRPFHRPPPPPRHPSRR